MEIKRRGGIEMKKYKSILAGVVLASGLLVGTSESSAQKNFVDMFDDESHSYAVNLLNKNNVFDYRTGNVLNGNKAITRGEVAKILHNIFGYENSLERTYKENFKDVTPETPFYDDIVWSYEFGIFSGSNGNFNPNQSLTRAQMAKILVEVFNLKEKSNVTFKDVSSKHWANEYINKLATAGVTTGDGKGNFMPEKSLTLNQLATFLVRDETLHRYLVNQVQGTKTPEYELTNLEGIKHTALNMWNNPNGFSGAVSKYVSEDLEAELRAYASSEEIKEEFAGYGERGKKVMFSVTKIDENLYEVHINIFRGSGLITEIEEVKKLALQLWELRARPTQDVFLAGRDMQADIEAFYASDEFKETFEGYGEDGKVLIIYCHDVGVEEYELVIKVAEME